ncbi:MAG TPA: hypothetical protein VIT41_01675 [Microlunatus sp.]
MTQTARTGPTTQEQIVDDLLRRVEEAWVEEAWVDEEFSAIVAANWPAEPPEPPPATGRGSAEPPLPASPAPLRPRGRPTATRVRPSLRRRQRSPPLVMVSITEH